MEKNNIKVFDVTLREGEQTPGLTFSPQEKTYLTQRMIEAGIRHIEIGLVGVKDDEAAYDQIVRAGLTEKAEISMTLLPCTQLFDKALEAAIKHINIVFPVTNCLTSTFGFNAEEFLKNNYPWVELVRRSDKKIRLALADASRFVLTDSQQKLTRDENVISENASKLVKLLGEFAEHGVGGFIFTDTVGLLTPSEVSLCMNILCSELSGVEWGVHFHNDFGLATANTLAAYEQGATLLQGSFNFLGERCGIASPAEIIAALRYLYGAEVNIDLAKIRRLAYEIEEITGMIINERQPVIGRGLYWYETATPLLTMLKQQANVFEMIPAEAAEAERKMVIGKHTSKKLFELYQSRGMIEQHHELKILKEMAARRREEVLQEMKLLIKDYHTTVEESYYLLSASSPDSLSATKMPGGTKNQPGNGNGDSEDLPSFNKCLSPIEHS